MNSNNLRFVQKMSSKAQNDIITMIGSAARPWKAAAVWSSCLDNIWVRSMMIELASGSFSGCE